MAPRFGPRIEANMNSSGSITESAELPLAVMRAELRQDMLRRSRT